MDFENVEDVYALTPIQEGMLFHTVSEPNSGVFVEQISSTIQGNLDVQHFKTAWSQTVARHGSLRTIFLWDGIDEPLQVVRSQVDLPWKQLNWIGKTSLEQQAQLTAYLSSDRTEGFDLTQAPLIRMALIQFATDQHRFIWSFHHLLSDGWSTPLILKEVYETYISLVIDRAIDSRPSLPYKDYVNYLRSQSETDSEAFWTKQLGDFSNPQRFTDLASTGLPVASGHGQQSDRLSAATTSQLIAFAKENRVTLNTVILGAWALLVKMQTRESDVVFGTTLSGRPPHLPGIESAIGLFINTLPIRIQVDKLPLVDWLRFIQKQQIEIRQFEYSPLASVQRWSGINNGEPLFESIVVFENYPEAMNDQLDQVGLSVSDFEYLEQSNYPLALLVVPQEHLEFHLVHAKSRFSDAFATKTLSHLNDILTSFVDRPGESVDAHTVLKPTERTKQAELFRGPKYEYEATTVHHLFEQQAFKSPHKVAVESQQQTWSYQDLDSLANQLAMTLISKGITSSCHIGLLAERSIEMVIGILGILKSGAAYVPLDPRLPDSRLQDIVTDARLSTIVATQELQERVLQLGSDFQIVAQPSTPVRQIASPTGRAKADGTAYLIYTSGSEGRPKGVPISHQNIVSSTLARTHFYQEDVGRFCLISSFSFDSSMVGIFWTLTSGGTLILPPAQTEQDVDDLAQFLHHSRTSHFLCLPSLYALLLEHSEATQLESLATVIVAGEACSNALAIQHHKRLPGVKLYNEYGPTEASVWCVATQVQPEMLSAPIPVGKPIANTSVSIVDDQLRPIPIGLAGELCVSGPGLAAGYLNRTDLSAEKFVTNPQSPDGEKMYRTGDLVYARPSGEIVFLGRIDQQVKIRGYRIELGEIEDVMVSHPAISEATVVARGTAVAPRPTLSCEELVTALNRRGPFEAAQIMQQITALSDEDLARELAQESS